MKKASFVAHCLKGTSKTTYKTMGVGTAPMNIALVKYWGKRDAELNLPVTSSLSLSLSLQTTTTVALLPHHQRTQDLIELNGLPVLENSIFYKRLVSFLDLFRPTPDALFHITTENDMPTAAGLASSASGFAALVLALDDFFSWQLPHKTLSMLARLGSGSACRSLFPGFVVWEKGESADGLDSFAEPILETWPELLMAYVPVSSAEKSMSSTKAMKLTVDTSPFYSVWPSSVARQMEHATQAIVCKDFLMLGTVAEESALLMHAMMLSARDPILYWLPQTVEVIHRVWQARREGFRVFLTMDAGPNVKLLFLEEHRKLLHKYFPEAEMMNPVWA